MIFHRRLIDQNQGGFILIELLLALVLTGLISSGIMMSIFQVFNANRQVSSSMIAITQAENLGYWITRDAEMAQSIIAGTENLTLAWGGWEYQSAGNTYVNTYKVSYIQAGSEIRRLQEVTTYDSSGQSLRTATSQMLVAKYITAIAPEMVGSQLVAVLITASVGEVEEARTYEITPRGN
jgi:type II secretory pathway pseudopilin PulG